MSPYGKYQSLFIQWKKFLKQPLNLGINYLKKLDLEICYSANDLTILTLNLVEQLSGVRKAHKISYC